MQLYTFKIIYYIIITINVTPLDLKYIYCMF